MHSLTQLMGTIKLLESKNAELQKTSLETSSELQNERVRSNELQAQVERMLTFERAPYSLQTNARSVW